MDLDLLKTFTDVARLGSFASVARERGTDPSSVSRHIAALEEALGFVLFERTTRRLALTEAGRVYLTQVDPLLEGLESARNAAQDAVTDPSGVLRVTTSVAFGERWLMRHIASFQDAYPAIDLNLMLSDSVVDIAGEGIDLAIRHAPTVEGDLIVSKLMDTAYRVVASSTYLKANPAPAIPEELSDHKGVVFSYHAFQGAWKFRRHGGTQIIEARPRAALTISSALAIRRATLEGMGVALLADWTVGDDLQAGRLVDLFPEHEVSAADFDAAAWIAYPSRSYLPMRVRLFIDHLRDCAKK